METEKLSILLIVNPTNDLPGTVEETDKIVEFLANNPGVEYLKLAEKVAIWCHVKSELSSGKYDVVHYAGHAFFDTEKRSKLRHHLSWKRCAFGFRPCRTTATASHAFFNACEAGGVRKRRTSPAKSRTRQEIRNLRKSKKASEWIESNARLAEAFLRGGVANYIGTYWPLGDASAAEFATFLMANFSTEL